MGGLWAAWRIRATVNAMKAISRHPSFGERFLMALLAAAIPSAALAAPEPKFTAEYGAKPYTFAATCDLARPLVFLNLVLANNRGTPTGPVRLMAQDSIHVFEGDTTTPQIPAGAEIPAILPLHRVASNPLPIGGTHRLTVSVVVNGSAGTIRLPPLDVTVPANLCTPAPATPAPTTAPSVATKVHTRDITAAVATQKPIAIGANASKVANVAVLVRPPAPVNVHSTGSGTDCGTHVGALGSLACPGMIASGDLLLIWDWQPDSRFSDVDGYRVYRIDSGLKQLVYTRAEQKGLTLVDVPKPAGGYNGKCYAVSAYVAKAESELSAPFCASGGSVAKTIQLTPNHIRSSNKQNSQRGNVFGDFAEQANTSPLVAGYSYAEQQHTLGDSFDNKIYRAAVAFDISPVLHRRVVAAKMRLQIQDTDCAGCVMPGGSPVGNNYSCATNLGTGTEFWWRNNSWIEAQIGLGIEPNDVGPTIGADVTPLVAAWSNGQPNYGFVLLNRDENLGAFMNKRCVTSYSGPVLEITYY